MNLQPAIDHLLETARVREVRVGQALQDVADALAKCVESSVVCDVVEGKAVMTDRHARIVAAAEAWAADWGPLTPSLPLQKALWEACQ